MRPQTGRCIGFGLLGALFACLALGGISHGDPNRLALGDGLLHRYVALHLTTLSHGIDPIVAESGTSLRYGRIGLPAAIWVTSAGKARAAPYSQAAIMVAAAGAVSAAGAVLLPTAPFVGPLLFWLAPGLALSITGGYAEGLALAFGLWAVWLATRGKWWVSSVLLALAMLTKENAIVIVPGLIIWGLRRGRVKGSAILAASVLPVGAWYLFVAARFGHVPILDPYLRASGTVGTPVVSLVRTLLHSSSESLAVVALHLCLVSAVLLLARRSLFGLIGTIAGIQLLFAGPSAWKWVGDASRISTFIQTFAVLAFIARWRPAWTAPGVLPERGESRVPRGALIGTHGAHPAG